MISFSVSLARGSDASPIFVVLDRGRRPDPGRTQRPSNPLRSARDHDRFDRHLPIPTTNDTIKRAVGRIRGADFEITWSADTADIEVGVKPDTLGWMMWSVNTSNPPDWTMTCYVPTDSGARSCQVRAVTGTGEAATTEESLIVGMEGHVSMGGEVGDRTVRAPEGPVEFIPDAGPPLRADSLFTEEQMLHLLKALYGGYGDSATTRYRNRTGSMVEHRISLEHSAAAVTLAWPTSRASSPGGRQNTRTAAEFRIWKAVS